MFFAISSIFHCQPYSNINSENVYAIRTTQQKAITLDALTGTAAIVLGLVKGIPALAAVGGLQLAPVVMFLTVAGFSRANGEAQKRFFVQFTPCPCTGSRAQRARQHN